jgi:hypothetical protein
METNKTKQTNTHQGMVNYHAFPNPALPQTMAGIQITTLHSKPAHMELMDPASWYDYE